MWCAPAGEGPVFEYAYVASSMVPGLPFFSSQLRLGRAGIEEHLPLPALSAAEAEGLRGMRQELLASIQKGVDFANK